MCVVRAEDANPADVRRAAGAGERAHLACGRQSAKLNTGAFRASGGGLQTSPESYPNMSAPAAAQKVFADRIHRIEVSATMAVTAEAAKLRAQGVNLVDFGAGEPHFATPRHIKDAAIAAIEANFTRYTAVSGIPELRTAIVERHAADFGSKYTPEEVVFTTGGKLALFHAVQVLVDHGDEVVLPAPFWVSFKDIIQYAGGKPVILQTNEADNFRVTAQAGESALRFWRRRPKASAAPSSAAVAKGGMQRE